MTRLIRLNEVLDRVPLRKSAIYAHIKAGSFPAPVKLGGASAWAEAEIDAYVKRLLDARPAAQASQAAAG